MFLFYLNFTEFHMLVKKSKSFFIVKKNLNLSKKDFQLSFQFSKTFLLTFFDILKKWCPFLMSNLKVRETKQNIYDWFLSKNQLSHNSWPQKSTTEVILTQGAHWDYTDWSLSEPNDGVNENCLIMSSHHGYKWVDELCGGNPNYPARPSCQMN